MKCPSCNYVYEDRYTVNGCEVIKGDKKFINIHTEHLLLMDNPEECTHGDYNYESKLRVYLKACPICKTVILDDN